MVMRMGCISCKCFVALYTISYLESGPLTPLWTIGICSPSCVDPLMQPTWVPHKMMVWIG